MLDKGLNNRKGSYTISKKVGQYCTLLNYKSPSTCMLGVN